VIKSNLKISLRQ
jgi:hypothetical protein